LVIDLSKKSEKSGLLDKTALSDAKPKQLNTTNNNVNSAAKPSTTKPAVKSGGCCGAKAKAPSAPTSNKIAPIVSKPGVKETAKKKNCMSCCDAKPETIAQRLRKGEDINENNLFHRAARLHNTNIIQLII